MIRDLPGQRARLQIPHDIRHEVEDAASLRSLQQSFHGIREIKVSDTSDFFAAEFNRSRGRAARVQYREALLTHAPRVAVEARLAFDVIQSSRALSYNEFMQYRLYRSLFPENPLLQFVALVVAAVMAVGAVFLGAILLSLFLGLALIIGIVLYVRLWWLRRSLSKRTERPGARSGDFVEVEYTVVEERSPSDTSSKDTEG